jgi:hypothetical protein
MRLALFAQGDAFRIFNDCIPPMYRGTLFLPGLFRIGTRTGSFLGLDIRLKSKKIIPGMPQVLLAAEIALGGLYGCMTKQELNLLNLSAIAVAELRTSPPQIMGCDMQQACLFAASLDHVPDDILRDAFAPDFSCSGHSAEDSASGNTGCCYPEIERGLGPTRNGNGPDVSALPD